MDSYEKYLKHPTEEVFYGFEEQLDINQVAGQRKRKKDKDLYDVQEDAKGECGRANTTEAPVHPSKPSRGKRGRDVLGLRTEPNSQISLSSFISDYEPLYSSRRKAEAIRKPNQLYHWSRRTSEHSQDFKTAEETIRGWN